MNFGAKTNRLEMYECTNRMYETQEFESYVRERMVRNSEYAPTSVARVSAVNQQV